MPINEPTREASSDAGTYAAGLLGEKATPLSEGETPKLDPITEVGNGSVQEKEKALLKAIQHHKSDKKCVIRSKTWFLGRKHSVLLNRNRGQDRHSANSS